MTDAAGGVRLMWGGAKEGPPTLVCFPCAGGTAAAFRPLIGALGDGAQVVAIEPPGHGFNTQSPPLDRIEKMVDVYDRVLRESVPGPYYFFGHSLGGLVSWLLAKRLEGDPARAPKAAIICTVRGPTKIVDSAWSKEDDDTLISRLDGIGGVPEAFRENLEDFKEWLPPVRADFAALEAFRGEDLEPLSVPLHIVGAKGDAYVDDARLREWLEYGVASQIRYFDGGHFFVQEQPGPLAEWLATLLRR